MSYKTKLFTALFLVYFIWGSTYLGVRYAIDILPPLLLTSIRFLVGGFLLFLFTLLKKQKLPSRAEFMGASYLGILLSGIGTGSVAYAIKYIPSGLVALLVAMLPFWVFLMDYFFFSKKGPSLLSGIGLMLGIIGIFFLLSPSEAVGDESSIPLFPVFIIILGSIAWGYGTLIGKATPQPAGLQTIAVQMFSGGAFALLLSLLTEENQWQAILNVDSLTFWSMAYLIFIGSYVGYTAFVWLMNNAPPLLTSTYAFVNPVVAMFLGWFFIDEKLTKQSLVAALIILLGVVFMTLGRRKLKAEA